MPYRRPDRLFLAVFTVAAPGILVLAGLVIFGVLSPVAALAAAAVAFALAGIIAWRHATDLARLRLRVDQLAAGENDPGYEATTVGDLSLAIARLGRQWQDEREKLAAERATADYILDALPDPLIVVDNSGMVVRANNAAEEIFETELTGRDLAAGLRHPILLRAVDSALSDGNSLAEEIAMPPPMNRNYSALVEPLGESADSGALILLHDLTPVRLGERMRADFVANVSHELRTPLSSLLGFVETLRGPAREDTEARDNFLGIMHEQAERMTRLIEDLLSLSRIEMDEHRRPDTPVDMRQVLAKVKDMLSMKARGRNMPIQITVPDTPATVPGDEDQLTQVFQNLIDNAIKYGGENTPVEVVVGQPDAAQLSVTVTDHGAGIPREHLPRLTERFYRVDAARSRQLGGTGLGLAIVKHIIARHRGQLDITSAEGEGSSFTVTLPIVADVSEEPPAEMTG